VRATSGVRELGDAGRSYRRAATAMVLGAGAYLAAHYVGEIAAVGLLTIGLLLHTTTEMFASAGEWTTSIELADDSHRGAYLSVFWLWPVLAAFVRSGALLTAVLIGRVAHPAGRLVRTPA
jgi:hypothetical protein